MGAFRFISFGVPHILEVPLIFRPDVDLLQVDLTLTIDGYNEPPIMYQVLHHRLDIILSQTKLIKAQKVFATICWWFNPVFVQS